MYGRGLRLAAMGLATALLSCASRASVVVHVETDIPWGIESADSLMRSIRVRVYSGVGDQTAARYDYTAPLGRQSGTVAIPVRFGVLPLNNDAGRTVTVRVDGCADTACRAEGSVIVTQYAIFSFIEGEQRELPMFLAMACQQRPCNFPQTTCRMGACVDPRIPPEQLVPSAWGFYDASAQRDTATSDGTVIDAPVVDTSMPDRPPVIDVGTDAPVADVRDASVVDTTVADVLDAPSLDARMDVPDAPATDVFVTDARDVTGTDTFDAGPADVRDATVADTVDAPSADVRDAAPTDTVDVFDNGFPCLCRTVMDCPQPRFNCCDTLVTNRCGSLNLALVCIGDLTCR